MPISAKTLDFLVENRLNNSRVWYQEHKAQYRELVLAPVSYTHLDVYKRQGLTSTRKTSLPK